MRCSDVLEGIDQLSWVLNEEKHLEVKPVQIAAQVEVLLIIRLIGERFTHHLKLHRWLDQPEALHIDGSCYSLQFAFIQLSSTNYSLTRLCLLFIYFQDHRFPFRPSSYPRSHLHERLPLARALYGRYKFRCARRTPRAWNGVSSSSGCWPNRRCCSSRRRWTGTRISWPELPQSPATNHF